MAGKIVTNPIQLNDHATATNNFVLKADNAGGVKLSRGNDGATSSDILSVASDGKVTLNQGETITVSKLQSATAQTTTVAGLPSSTPSAGLYADFTGIPSWVKRITVMFGGVSLSGTSDALVQLGDSGGIETTGYTSFSSTLGTSAISQSTSTAGFVARLTVGTNEYHGQLILSNLSGNVWVGSLGGHQTTASSVGGGSKTLSATLDRLRITTVNGTDTFDAGSINIMWE